MKVVKHGMKIVAGLGAIDDYERLVKAGADEFFCGYIPYEWLKKYGILFSLNRREVLYYNVQIGSLEDMKILSKMVQYYGVPVKITLNSLYYTKEQYEWIYRYINELLSLGFDTYIFADPGLILYLRSKNVPIKIHVSGELAEVNREMMKLWNEYDITRYIFHRKNTIEDMKECIKQNEKENKKLEYEAFILNELCHFTGGYCNSLHCDELAHMCKVPYQPGIINEFSSQYQKTVDLFQRRREELEEEEWKKEGILGDSGCGLCSIKQLKEAGITHLKLVGRGNYIEKMERDIKELKKAIKMASQIETYEEYKSALMSELFVSGCSGKCYY